VYERFLLNAFFIHPYNKSNGPYPHQCIQHCV